MLDGLGIRGAPLSPRLFKREDSFGRNGKPLSPEELQAQVHACDPFWRLLNQPARDRAEILSKISDDPAVLQQRDPAGASPLLYLALLKSSDHIAIAKEILEREESKDRITDQYDVEPYIGENILHIAIVNKDVAFARLSVTDEAHDPFIAACRELAAKYGLWIHTGSTPLAGADGSERRKQCDGHEHRCEKPSGQSRSHSRVAPHAAEIILRTGRRQLKTDPPPL